MDGGAAIEGMLPKRGVRWCFGGLACADPELLKEVVELLKPLLRKLESIFTGDGGRKDLDLSPSAVIRIDFKTFEYNERKGPVKAGLIGWYCARSKSIARVFV
jgi:hypothetical protein